MAHAQVFLQVLWGDLTGWQQVRWKGPWTPSENDTHLGVPALLLPSCLTLGGSLNFSDLHFHLSNKGFGLDQLSSKLKKKKLSLYLLMFLEKNHTRKCK